MSTDALAGGWAKVLGGDRKQFNMFIEKMMDGFAYHKIVVDKAGKPIDYVFLEVNHAFEKMTGLKRAQILGKKVTKVLNGIEKDPADWIGVYGRVALTGEPVEFENHAEPLGKWYRISAYCPEKGYFVALFEDISECKKAEYELWQAKKDWERTFDSVPDFVAILDNHYRIVRANRAMAQQLGITPEKAIGLFCYECVHGLDNSPDFCPHAQTVKDGKEHQAEVHEPRLGGDFLVTTTPLKDEQGRMVGSVHVARNITKRKQREREIENIARFPSENPNPIFRIDGKGTILYGNLAGNSLLVAWNSKVGDRAPERISRVVAETLASDTRVELEQTYGAKTFSLLFAPVTLEGYVNIYANDITKRKKLETETQHLLDDVQQERDRLQSLLNSMNDEVWFADTEKKFTLANPSAVKEFRLESSSQNVDVENLAATSEVYRTDGSLRPIDEAPPLRALKGEIIKNEEEIVRTPVRGELRTRQVSSAPVRDASGTIVGSVSVVRDVTEIKNLEKQLQDYTKNLEETVEQRTLSLKASEEKYRILFDSIDEGFCIIEMVFDGDGKPSDYRFLEINDSFERQTGMHDAKGKLMRSFAPNHEAYWFEIYGKVAVTGKPVRFTNEAKELNRWYDVYAFPVGEEKTRKVGILFNDITKRMNLEKQLKDSERLAAIGATAGMVGHDIRNPLQAITSDLYLAETELASIPNSEEKKNAIESLQEIGKNVDYINKIVADLQDFARPLKPNAEETDVKFIIEDLLKKNGLPENVKVSVRVETDARKVVADASYVSRIIYNLVTNAVQAMPKGGKLTIHAYKEANDLLITVKDTGVGIPEKVKGKLFTPMFTTKSKGQGFGLAVIKRMTESLGGTVTFESQEGKGTTFTIRLPLNR